MAAVSTSSVPRLQEILEDLVSREQIRQAVIALETMDRMFEWSGAVGEAHPDGSPVEVATPFFVASIDKLLNASIAMKLSESGKLDLDATISTYLPHSLTQGLHRMGGVDYVDRITVRHLLGHTSGLADWLEDLPRDGQSLVGRVADEGDRVLSIDDMMAFVRDQLKPHFPPQDLDARRQKVRYSDTNFMLLIAILESVTGQPLHQIHDRLLLRPLNMRHTYFPGHSQPLDPTPPAAPLRFEGRPLLIPEFIRSIRGIYSTSGDCLTFLRSFVRGEVFDHLDTLAAMQQRWGRFGPPLDRAALRAPSWPIEYGLGIMRFRLPRILAPLHPVPPVIGHTGSTGCWLFYCEQWDIVLTGSVDEVTAGAVPFRVVPRILNALQ